MAIERGAYQGTGSRQRYPHGSRGNALCEDSHARATPGDQVQRGHQLIGQGRQQSLGGFQDLEGAVRKAVSRGAVWYVGSPPPGCPCPSLIPLLDKSTEKDCRKIRDEKRLQEDQ